MATLVLPIQLPSDASLAPTQFAPLVDQDLTANTKDQIDARPLGDGVELAGDPRDLMTIALNYVGLHGIDREAYDEVNRLVHTIEG